MLERVRNSGERVTVFWFRAQCANQATTLATSSCAPGEWSMVSLRRATWPAAILQIWFASRGLSVSLIVKRSDTQRGASRVPCPYKNQTPPGAM
jgi:hypothetical protein